jgi:C-methyltransferase C-terminal domain/Putative zinc binding domain/Methyltransferase domain
MTEEGDSFMHIDHCRVCHGLDLHPFLDLGETALANSYLLPGQLAEPEPKYPLRVALCRSCGLVQIDEEVPPEMLFKNYLYVSGTSDLVHSHARFLAEHFTRTGLLKSGELVLEAASNDGTILKAFQKHRLRTVGIEPAQNIAGQANADGVETICQFFNVPTAWAVRDTYGPAKLILARHVLAHVADLHGFVEGLRIVLDDDGLAVVECPHLLPFHEHLEYDTVYHEHLCYFSLGVLQALFERIGLELVDVLEVPIHGGSIVASAQRTRGPRHRTSAVDALLARERAAGLHVPERWDVFARRVALSRELLREELARLQARGKKLAGYGAPAKGMTLLAYCALGDELPYLVDKSLHKQGRLTPGHHIPILHPGQLLVDQPDVVLLLAWNFAAEVVRQQAEYVRRRGRFLLPLPEPHYWEERPVSIARAA